MAAGSIGYGVDKTFQGFASAGTGEILKSTVAFDLFRRVLIVNESDSKKLLTAYLNQGLPEARRIEELLEPISPAEDVIKENFEIQHNKMGISRFTLKVDDRVYAQRDKTISFNEFKKVVYTATGDKDYRKTLLVLKLMDENMLRETFDELRGLFPMHKGFHIAPDNHGDLVATYDTKRDCVLFQSRFKVLKEEDGSLDTFISMLTTTEFDFSKMYETKVHHGFFGSTTYTVPRIDRISRRIICSQ